MNDLRKAADMALEALETSLTKETLRQWYKASVDDADSKHYAKHLQSQKTHASLNYAHS
jgi:CRISPR/Cas system-associated endonuclease Cas1